MILSYNKIFKRDKLAGSYITDENMSYKIVVSRYNEDINWLLNNDNNCIIYNKGDLLNVKNEISLPNVGRESHTYLHYIITNYDNLPDVVCFTQGKISDIGLIDTGYNTEYVSHLIMLVNEAKTCGISKYSSLFYEKDKSIHCCSDWNIRNIPVKFLKYKDDINITFKDWFEKYIRIKYPDPIRWMPNAIFAVRKDKILKNDKEYYKNLITTIDYDSNPIEGHFFERSWFYIFDPFQIYPNKVQV